MKSRMMAVAFAGLTAAQAQAVVVNFNDFSSTAGLQLNAAAAGNVNNGIDSGRVLRLTPASPSQAGSAFSTTQVNMATFSTFFRFRITSPDGSLFDGNTETGADGIVFVVQPVANNVGGGGQGIGYDGIPTSLGVEFDTWHNSFNNDPNSNHLGIDLNGSVFHSNPGTDTLNYATRFDDGNLWYAWVDYDGTTLEVRLNQSGVRALNADLSKTLNLASIVGQTTAFIGFTSGTGADWGNHDLVGWEFRDSYNPITNNPPPNTAIPEPMTATLAGLAGLGLMAHTLRRRRA